MVSVVLPEALRTVFEPRELLEKPGSAVRVMSSPQELEAWNQLRDQHPIARAVYPTYSTAAGWRPLRLGYFADGRLAGGLLLTLRRVSNLPFTSSRILCAMLDPSRAGEMMDDLLVAVDRLALLKAMIETEVQLRIPANEAIPGFEWWADAYQALWKHGYRRLPRVDRTYFVRVDRPDAELLASFGQQPRNRIKKAIKDGSKVECSTDPALLELFFDSYVQTVERKQVAGRLPRSVVVGGIGELMAQGRALLFVEKYGEAISNMVIVDPLGVPCAMLATRTRDNVAGKIPSSAQHVHYTAMRAMRDRGKVWYDLGGCEGPVPFESHPNFGVWHFKYAFKGSYVTFLPSMRKIRGELTRSILDLVHRHRGDPVGIQ